MGSLAETEPSGPYSDGIAARWLILVCMVALITGDTNCSVLSALRDGSGTGCYMSRMVRHRKPRAYEIHRSICRNSPVRCCPTYGAVGYGYVSV